MEAAGPCGWIDGLTTSLRSAAAGSRPTSLGTKSKAMPRLLADATDVVECLLRQKIFVAADDDAIGADPMHCEFLDHRIKVLGGSDDRDTADGAANQLIGVVEYGGEAVIVGAVGLQKADIERGQPGRADHDDVLGCRKVAGRHRWFIILGQQHHDGARGQKSGGEDEDLQDRGGARNALEAGEGKQNHARQQSRCDGGLDHVEGVMNGEMPVCAVTQTENEERDQRACQREDAIEDCESRRIWAKGYRRCGSTRRAAELPLPRTHRILKSEA